MTADDLTPAGATSARLALKAARDAEHIRELEAAVDRVRRLHDNDQHGLLAPGRWCPGCGYPIPCPTIRALNGPDSARTDTTQEARPT